MKISLEDIFSQEIRQRKVFEYSNIEHLDDKSNTIECLNVRGLIVFSEVQEYDFISITIGDSVVYNGQISQTKIENISQESKLKVYLTVMEFQGYKVPLQIFEFYDTNESEYIPQFSILNTHSAETGEVVQRQLFKGIKRLK